MQRQVLKGHGLQMVFLQHREILQGIILGQVCDGELAMVVRKGEAIEVGFDLVVGEDGPLAGGTHCDTRALLDSDKQHESEHDGTVCICYLKST